MGSALDVLKENSKIRTIDSDLVFTAGKTAASGRHSAASYLAMSGASLLEIAEVLRHKTLQMLKRYAHLSDSHTAQIVGGGQDKMSAANAD